MYARCRRFTASAQAGTGHERRVSRPAERGVIGGQMEGTGKGDAER